MARKRKPKDTSSVELNMTAMIDVVFQLLIFFMVSAVHPDQLTQLNMSQARSSEGSPEEQEPPTAQIVIAPDGVMMNDQVMSKGQLDDALDRLARNNPRETVLIRTSAQSKHEQLVDVLDLCTKASLTNLSIMSTE